MSRLILRHLSGSKANQEQVFSEEELTSPVTIGRDSLCRVCIGEADDACSRQHARIELSADGFKVFDLNSSNGLFINGKRVAGDSPLQHEDILQLGRGGPELCFKLDPPPAAHSKATRVVENFAAKETREVSALAASQSRDAGVLQARASTSTDSAGAKVGRATVERMFISEKKRSSRQLINLVAAMVGVIALIAG